MDAKIISNNVYLSKELELGQSPQKKVPISEINKNFHTVESLQNPSNDSFTELKAKFGLITNSQCRINKCTYGTFCCRSKGREYANSFHILEILIDILIFPFLLILFVIFMLIWSIAMILYWFSIEFSCCFCVNSRTMRYSQLKKIEHCVFTSNASLMDKFVDCQVIFLH